LRPIAAGHQLRALFDRIGFLISAAFVALETRRQLVFEEVEVPHRIRPRAASRDEQQCAESVFNPDDIMAELRRGNDPYRQTFSGNGKVISRE
jgi:hypothetical protein